MLNKLGALLKYEFPYYLKILPPLYLAAVLLAIAARYQASHRIDAFWGMGESFLSIILTAFFVAITVITTVLIIQRYIGNFFKGSASLMFTLPVTVWALVASKAIAALCMVLMSAITVVASYFIFYTGKDDWIGEILKNYLLNMQGTDLPLITISIIAAIIMIFQQTCLIYAVITSSYILPRFRFVAACAMYLLIENLLVQRVFRLVSNYAESYLNNAEPFITRIPTCLTALALAALFFWSAGMLLSRSYNLE